MVFRVEFLGNLGNKASLKDEMEEENVEEIECKEDDDEIVAPFPDSGSQSRQTNINNKSVWPMLILVERRKKSLFNISFEQKFWVK